MIMTDVNVLIYAHRQEFPEHKRYKRGIEQLIAGDEPYGMADFVLSSFLRIVTHRRVFSPPSSMREALAFVDAVRERANCVAINPGDRHWQLFTELCRQPDIKGGLVADAYLAALAIEHGCEFITKDGDFARFAPKLRLRSW